MDNKDDKDNEDNEDTIPYPVVVVVAVADDGASAVDSSMRRSSGL